MAAPDLYRPERRLSPVKRFFRIAFFSALCFVAIRLFLFESYSVSDPEMLPGAARGDRILANRFWNGLRLPLFNNTKILDFISPSRGDLVFIKHPWFSQSGIQEFFDFLTFSLFDIARDIEVRLVRVLARGGEYVRIDADGAVYVSGEKINRRKTGEFELPSGGRFEIYQEGEWEVAQAIADPGIAARRVYPRAATNRALAADMAETWLTRTLAGLQCRIESGDGSPPSSALPPSEESILMRYDAAGNLWYRRPEGEMSQLISVQDGIAWLIVPKGMLFVLHDFREAREDSRRWGPIFEETVTGIPFFRFWPLSRLGALD